jgi:hypothetical protein
VEKNTVYGPLAAGPDGAVFLRVTPHNLEWDQSISAADVSSNLNSDE